MPPYRCETGRRRAKARNERRAGSKFFALVVLAVARLKVPGRETHVRVLVRACPASTIVDRRTQSGTIDSGSSKFVKNSTVLSIPVSQREPGRRTVKAAASFATVGRSIDRRKRTRAGRSVTEGSVRCWMNDARAAWAPRSIGYRTGDRAGDSFGRCRPMGQRSYLVDPASSHMLVSKIKPCMSKHKLLHSEAANGSLGHPLFLGSYNPTWITVVILELIHASKLRPLRERARLLDQNQSGLRVRTFGDSG